jgi:hypothetical protein
MKRLYIILVSLILASPFAASQIVTERCFHLDKVQFLQQRQDFWRSHKLFTTSAQPSLFTGGFYNLTEGHRGFGLYDVGPSYAHHYWGITTINGWHFAGGLAAGVGVGYFSYNDGYTMPVYGDLRYFFGKQRVKFFVMADGGFLMNFDNFPEYTRFFGNPGGGLIVPLANGVHLSFSTGLMTQWVMKSSTDQHRRDSFINMKLGFLFGK